MKPFPLPSGLRSLAKAFIGVKHGLSSVGSVFLRRFPAGHFYSPLPSSSEVDSALARSSIQATRGIAGLDLRPTQQLALFREFADWQSQMPFSQAPSSERRYYLDNVYFSYADAFSLYGMLRKFKPRQVVEVGSGFSSAAMLDSTDALQSEVKFTFIDPYPQRLQTLLRPTDKGRARIQVSDVQSIAPSVFEGLAENDILFIDSSHVAKIGSDVLYLMFEVLPKLATGVIVHVHDIPWPFEYPRAWYRDGRCWNEAYLLRAFLQFNEAFELLLFNGYLAECHTEELRPLCPFFFEQASDPLNLSASSLWLRRC